MLRLVLVCAGGALGSGARYLVGGWVAAVAGAGFPYGTLLINAVGSFLISVVMYLGLAAGVIGPDLRVFLASGIMGGFTTYSSFNYETLALVERGAWGLAGAYVAATLAGCLATGVLGLAVARGLAGAW
ncbi:MAG TPA: CrcB family protein [Anaeromyxobacteraceae bacterium]|nr:CrcB family protein [Anaeromyxobacteraceae bacterium]